MRATGPRRAQAHDDFDAGDLHALGGLRSESTVMPQSGMSIHLPLVLEEEVVVFARVVFEIRLRPVEGELTQEAGFRELVQV